jgi:tetratricopeptide (TPR) repeat protein
VDFNPDYAYNYYYLGRVYLDLGKLILAETAFSASIVLLSDRYIFYKYRAEVYEKMADYKSAEDDYKKALSLKPNDPRLKEALIKVISKQTEQQFDFE